MIDATPLLRLYAAFRSAQLARQNPAQIQEQQLLSLLHQASSTKFGKAYDFGSIRSVKEYQQRVPLRRYEQFWTEWWQPEFPRLKNCTWPGTIPYFPVSSGTSSGTTKFLPYTHQMTSSNTKAGLDLLVHHLNARPKSKLFAGKSFVLGGSTDLVEQARGIYSGDLSGIAVKTLKCWAKSRYFPPSDVALLKDWEEKIDVLARLSLKEPIRSISGVPSWMLILFGKYQELAPQFDGTLASIFPDLEMLVHGGVNFAPYYRQFCEILKGGHAELREVYPASEGFIAVGDRNYGEGLRVVLDHGLFYEFVPLDELDKENPTRHWIQNIELDVNYAIVLSSCAGVWSYILGDTVRFIDRETPRLLITGRTSYYLSAFGEHLIADEIEDGIDTASQQLGATIVDYSVGALYPERAGGLGGHLYVLEFSSTDMEEKDLEKFAEVLDRRLRQRNEDYDAHRADGFGLNPPKIVAVPRGTFADWMKSRGKLGGQHKVPRIITNPELFNDLRSFVGNIVS